MPVLFVITAFSQLKPEMMLAVPSDRGVVREEQGGAGLPHDAAVRFPVHPVLRVARRWLVSHLDKHGEQVSVTRTP